MKREARLGAELNDFERLFDKSRDVSCRRTTVVASHGEAYTTTKRKEW